MGGRGSSEEGNIADPLFHRADGLATTGLFMAERITIIGDGAMATVCSMLAVHAGHEVTIWGARRESIERLKGNREQARLLPGARVPDEVRLTGEDSEAFGGCTMVMSAIPTQYMRGVWTRLAAYAPRDAAIVSVAKGIENGTLLRPTEVLQEVLGKQHGVAVLSGPNIAAEMARKLPATAVAASEDEALARRVQGAFSTEWFRVYTNDDMLGVELAGATKNIIALAAGILDGMGAGNNAKAGLVTRGLVEISRLGAELGAKPATFQGLAGLGDLITTCFSPEGRNRRVGEAIGRGKTLEEVLASTPSVAEGVPTTRAAVELAGKLGVEMPITETLHAILFKGKSVRAGLAELMTRGPKGEGE
jgi:glycerol-3-phosphate dehydrogenase (NAD(P)+)